MGELAPKTLPLAHLVGSVPLSSTEEVFKKISSELSGVIKSIPDGETGERGMYIIWQNEIFPPEVRASPIVLSADNPYLYDQQQKQQQQKNSSTATFPLKLEHVKPTGYDKAALASYKTFLNLRTQGLIPPDVRFQVCLPTPVNPAAAFVAPEYVFTAESLYETRLLEALDAIQGQIPSADLAIQWDMAVEPAHMEHAYGPPRKDFTMFKPYYSPVKEGIAERVGRLASHVKKEVPMGFHLCYGDEDHAHYLQPRDLGLLVDLTNAVYGEVAKHRTLEWFHVPVPKDRTDDAYFAPLGTLKVGSETSPVLGLVHAHDDEGTRTRIEAASRALAGKRFGVATECGLGRTPVKDLDSIFEIKRKVTKGD